MEEWIVSEQDIDSVEHLLLPVDAHFPDDAKAVIRSWNSTDVVACPGSGKTTVLLAKLKLIADRMPLDSGAGICVLSHTNVAVNEIKNRLSGCADKLMSYPNYIGTIQSFVDKFVTIHYLQDQSRVSLSFVDDSEYAVRLFTLINNKPYPSPYYKLNTFISMRYQNGRFPYNNVLEFFKNISLREDGIYHRNDRLAGINSDSYKQYLSAKEELLTKQGILRYQDTYAYANEAVESLSDDYTCLFSNRFRYVFIDEYQDCDKIQRDALGKLFDTTKCCVFHIGDIDQSIFNSLNADTSEWSPSDKCLQIITTSRYGQCIANILTPLRRNKDRIISRSPNDSARPTVIVFDDHSIKKVIWKFIVLLDENGLNSPDGIYKAIGAIRKDNMKGLSIGSYWDDFDSRPKKKEDKSYWGMIDSLVIEIESGRVYHVENITRKLLCRLFHFAGITDAITGKELSFVAMRKALHDRYWSIYTEAITQLVETSDYNRDVVDRWFKKLLNTLFKDTDINATILFNRLPNSFLEMSKTRELNTSEINVYFDPIKGRRIEFDTIHGVKGETHDATLYLETDRKGASDLNRILPYYGVDKIGASSLYDYSRKLAYVGFSRPRKLLCVAMQSKTYEKIKCVIDKDWDVVDIRS